MLVLTVLALNVFGDGVRDALDPRAKVRLEHSMARFVVRRVLGMVLVMFAVSVLTFLIFNVIPNNDPASRMAGKTTTAAADRADPRGLGLRRSALRPVRDDDEEGLHRRPASRT